MTVLYPKYRHSVSSANLWRACPSAFIWRYGLQKWGKDNERIWMGKAAEAAYANALLSNLNADQVHADAVQRFYGLSGGIDCPEAEASGWIARGFLEETRGQWGKLIQHNPWRPVRLDGLDKEISLKPDFIFENAVVDTKATMRVPSEPSAPHVRQIAAYAKEWGKSAILFYGSIQTKNKEPIAHKTAIFEIEAEQAEKAIDSLMLDWRQIERWNQRFASPQDAASVTALDTDSFYWDEDDIETAIEFWTKEN